jgi:hypothetical protein
MVSCDLHALAPSGDGLRGVSATVPGQEASFVAHPLMVLPSLRSLTGGGRQIPLSRSGTSPGVPSPSAPVGSGQQVAPELPTSDLPARLVSHRFTPSTPPRSVLALFRASSALGVAPSRAFIFPKIRAPLGVGYPLVVDNPRSTASRAGTRRHSDDRAVGEGGGPQVLYCHASSLRNDGTAGPLDRRGSTPTTDRLGDGPRMPSHGQVAESPAAPFEADKRGSDAPSVRHGPKACPNRWPGRTDRTCRHVPG